MGRDKRGSERGNCKKCMCEEYELPSSGHDCEYCGHKPFHHSIVATPPKKRPLSPPKSLALPSKKRRKASIPKRFIVEPVNVPVKRSPVRKSLSEKLPPKKSVPTKSQLEKSPAKRSQNEKLQLELSQTKKCINDKLQPKKSQNEKVSIDKSPAKKSQNEKLHTEKSPVKKSLVENSQPEKSPAEKLPAKKSLADTSEIEKSPAVNPSPEKSPAEISQVTNSPGEASPAEITSVEQSAENSLCDYPPAEEVVKKEIIIESADEEAGKGDRHDWSRAEVRKLIVTVHGHSDEFRQKNHAQVWEKIAKLMNLPEPKCRHKWKYLKKKYNEYVESRKKKGTPPQGFAYAKEMEQTLQSNPKLRIVPLSTLSWRGGMARTSKSGRIIRRPRALTPSSDTSSERVPSPKPSSRRSPSPASDSSYSPPVARTPAQSRKRKKRKKEEDKDSLVLYLKERNKRLLDFLQKMHDENEALMQQLIDLL